jgi:hypothetical protein
MTAPAPQPRPPLTPVADDELPPELRRFIEALARAHVDEDYAAALAGEREVRR